LVPINRARGQPAAVEPGALQIAARARHDGYSLSGFVPRQALTGYDPEDQPRIALYYAAVDRELGWQTLTLGPEYPVTDDPSLWSQAVLSD
jgi:hypothetical protein